MASDDDDAQPHAAPPTDFQNKLEEQAKAKGGLSYTYFAANGGANANAAPVAAPVRLTAEQEAALKEQQNAAAEGKGSQWNAAGTYEEKDVSAWARKRTQELLEGVEVGPGGVVRVTSVACTGEAHVVFVRGKRRAAFELKVTIGWEVASGAEEQVIKGTARTAEEGVTGDDIDDEDDVELVVALEKGSEGADSAASALRASSLPSLLWSLS
jgi:hypothetical protein